MRHGDPETDRSTASKVETTLAAWDIGNLGLAGFGFIIQAVMSGELAWGIVPGSSPDWSRLQFVVIATIPWAAWLALYFMARLIQHFRHSAPRMSRAVRQLSSGVVAWWLGVGWFMVVQSIAVPYEAVVFAGFDARGSSVAGATLLLTGSLLWTSNFIARGRLEVFDEQSSSAKQREIVDRLDRLQVSLADLVQKLSQPTAEEDPHVE